MAKEGEVVAKKEMHAHSLAGHDIHDGDGMAHHRKAQHEHFSRHTEHLHAIPGVMDTDVAGPPDGAPHNPDLYTEYGEKPYDGIAGENMPMHGYSGAAREHGGGEVSANLPGGSPC